MTIEQANRLCAAYDGKSDLDLSGLTSAEHLKLPEQIGGWLYLRGLTSAERKKVVAGRK